MNRNLCLAGPTDRRPPFRFSAHARVWFSDTDAQGVARLPTPIPDPYRTALEVFEAGSELA